MTPEDKGMIENARNLLFSEDIQNVTIGWLGLKSLLGEHTDRKGFLLAIKEALGRSSGNKRTTFYTFSKHPLCEIRVHFYDYDRNEVFSIYKDINNASSGYPRIPIENLDATLRSFLNTAVNFMDILTERL